MAKHGRPGKNMRNALKALKRARGKLIASNLKAKPIIMPHMPNSFDLLATKAPRFSDPLRAKTGPKEYH